MSKKLKIIISCAILSAISVMVYLYLRTESLEKDYTDIIAKSYNAINSSFLKIEPDINFSDNTEHLRDFFERSIKSYPGIAVIAVSDKPGTIKLASKNDRYIKSAEMFDSIINDFSGKKLQIEKGKRFLVRYYESGGHKKEQHKFYIFTSIGERSSLLTVFPYDPGIKLIMKFVAEILLVVILTIMVYTALYIMLRPKPQAEITPDTENSDTPAVELSAASRPFAHREASGIRIASGAASDTLNKFVFDLFKKIYDRHSPQSISLYLKNTPETLSKTYELKGKSFIRIESNSYDIIDMKSGLAEELKKSSSILLENGKRIILPLIYEKSLLGMISISTQSGIDSAAISDLKSEILSITQPVSEFLVISGVMVDRATGLFGRVYFKMRMTELISMKQAENKDFSLLMIYPLKRDEAFSRSHYFTIVKLISPAVIENLPPSSQLFLYDENIAALIPSKEGAAYESALNIQKTLVRFKIKITQELSISITPYIGIASSENSSDAESIVARAIKNLNDARLKDSSEIVR